MKQWYELLYENYGEKYDSEPFAQGTNRECDFIESELGNEKLLKIIDIGCGTGRHSIELAKRGYNVTGVDLSDAQLKAARQKAEAQNLHIDFRKSDARHLPFENEFDVAIMLCEGAFPLMETDDMNYEILKSAAKAIKDHGKIIFTTLNGLFPLYHSVEKFCAESSKDGPSSYINGSFDLMTFRNKSIITVTDDSGVEKELTCSERYYVPSEITWLLKNLGFKKIDIYGARLGAFSREHALTPDDFEMLVIAEK